MADQAQGMTPEQEQQIRDEYARAAARQRGSSHWDGCVVSHPTCAIGALLAALDQARQRAEQAARERSDARLELGKTQTILALERQQMEAWMPCPDCRDKVRHEGCQRCARQQAEARCAGLAAHNAQLRALVQDARGMLKLLDPYGKHEAIDDYLDRSGAALAGSPAPEVQPCVTREDWRAASLLKIRTRRTIAERTAAGESAESIAADYGVPLEFVTLIGQAGYDFAYGEPAHGPATPAGAGAIPPPPEAQ